MSSATENANLQGQGLVHNVVGERGVRARDARQYWVFSLAFSSAMMG